MSNQSEHIVSNHYPSEILDPAAINEFPTYTDNTKNQQSEIEHILHDEDEKAKQYLGTIDLAPTIDVALDAYDSIPDAYAGYRVDGALQIYEKYRDTVSDVQAEQLREVVVYDAYKLAAKILPEEMTEAMDMGHHLHLDDIGAHRPPSTQDTIRLARAWDVTDDSDLRIALGSAIYVLPDKFERDRLNNAFKIAKTTGQSMMNTLTNAGNNLDREFDRQAITPNTRYFNLANPDYDPYDHLAQHSEPTEDGIAQADKYTTMLVNRADMISMPAQVVHLREQGLTHKKELVADKTVVPMTAEQMKALFDDDDDEDVVV